VTPNEAIALAYRLCDDDPNNPRFDATAVLSIANSVYREVCRDCLTYPATGAITTVSGTREYSYPTGVAVIERAEWLPSGATVGKKLVTTRFNRIQAMQGVPVYYYLRGILLGVDPLPDGAYTVNVWGYGVPTADIGGAAEMSYIPTVWQEAVAYGIAARLMEIDQGIDSQEYIKWARIFAAKKGEIRRFMHGGNSADHRPGVG
jgi:hypothetical protein